MLKNGGAITEEKEYSYGDFDWRMTYLCPAEADERGPEAAERKIRKFRCRNTPGSIRLCIPKELGKITDGGCDQFVCCFTSVPAHLDADITAEIRVSSFLTGPYPDYQEGFGVFIRDTMDADPATGLYYSNMAAAGGLLGRANVFIREGVHAGSFEKIRNRWLCGDRTAPDDPEDMSARTFKICLKKNGGRITAGIFDKDGTPRSCVPCEPDAGGGFAAAEGGMVAAETYEGCFAERTPDEYYIGFMAARGADISIDKKSVRVVFKKSESMDAHAVYAAADGTAAGSGSKDDPLDLATALKMCRPGLELRLLPGTYVFTDRSIRITKDMSGRPDAKCRLTGISEDGMRPVLDLGGTENAFLLEADDWEIRGISVTAGFGMKISGSRNTIEDCRAYGNLETGFLIRHPDIDAPRDDWPSFNIFRNCVSYNNRDASEHNADGFAAKIAAGDGNRFEDCTAFLNSDDGFDLFAKNRSTGAVVIKGCESCLNGYRQDAEGRLVETSGTGNGFKLGGSGMAVLNRAEGCRAVWNKGAGFTSNSNPVMILKNCVSENNKKNYRHYYYGPDAVPVKIMENCAEGSAPAESAAGLRAECLKELKERFGS